MEGPLGPRGSNTQLSRWTVISSARFQVFDNFSAYCHTVKAHPNLPSLAQLRRFLPPLVSMTQHSGLFFYLSDWFSSVSFTNEFLFILNAVLTKVLMGLILSNIISHTSPNNYIGIIPISTALKSTIPKPELLFSPFPKLIS